MTSKLELLFQKIAIHDDAFFKHQQIDEPDLTSEDRLKILSDLFKTNPRIFLERYEQFIEPADSSLFENPDDLTISLILHRILTRKNKSTCEVRNRRYVALQKLQKEGEFFSDLKMREREPYLYDVMVGKYLTEEEKYKLRPSVDKSCKSEWSEILTQFETTEEISQRRNAQKLYYEGEHEEKKEGQKISRFFAHVENSMENEDEVEDNMTELKEEIDRISKEEAELMEGDDPMDPEILREEFLAHMFERFLAGKDSRFFDYTKVDKEEYDAFDDIRARDEEEAWFDED